MDRGTDGRDHDGSLRYFLDLAVVDDYRENDYGWVESYEAGSHTSDPVLPVGTVYAKWKGCM